MRGDISKKQDADGDRRPNRSKPDRSKELMTRRKQLLLTCAAILSMATSARAESYCVACFGPDAIYRCVIADAPAGAAPDPRNQVQCIKQLAKSGPHARCSVERFSTKGCNGPERVIQPSTAAIPLTPPPPAAATPEALPASDGVETEPVPVEPAQEPAGPPQTVEELAKTTVESTKKGLGDVGSSVKNTTEKAGEKIEDAGSAIGNAAKKTWNCVTSLFSDC
ncbi:MAG: hypothetical protein C0519_09390 [Hyphomicrobium sp.]|nr:hypothetical protein [Hyphomicrobium sp.]PPD09252.1 MAG: hypothetical protein CTY28_00020 [Hyphomicrobium sp.]